MSESDTKARILDSAEQLFAEQGFESTSLRAITAAAGVNLAAVNYHFGSKEGLLGAVLERGMGPINAERIRLLDEAEAAAGSGLLEVEAVLRALIAPAIRLGYAEGEDPGRFVQLMGRVHSDPDERLGRLFQEVFSEVRARFIPAFRRALPDLSLAEVFWRAHFVVGAMAHTLIWSRKIVGDEAFPGKPPDPEELMETLVAFSAAGMKAGPPRGEGAPRSEGGETR